MEYRSTIFYLALLIIVGGIAELYVRMKGLGENVQKIRGVAVERKPRLGPPILLVIGAIVTAVMTIPH